jgi:broad specificity phosphatase PhoE
MNNTIHFLRHALPIVQKDIPQSKWLLSEEGITQARARRIHIGVEFDAVFSSTEQKAIQTTEVIVSDSLLEIQEDRAFNELDRDLGPFLPQVEYKLAIEKAMKEPSKSVHGWETAQSARYRFIKGVQRIDEEYSSKQILVVSHGIVLSLYFANLLNLNDFVYNRWLKLRFCSMGIVENGIVVTDIVE